MELKEQRPITIYTLSCPFSGAIKYVGKTVKPLNKRLGDHIGDVKRTVNKRTNWVKSILRRGEKPIIEGIETVYDGWQDAEIYWIAQLRAWGFSLKNMTEGGEGGHGRINSEDTRRKISVSQKGKPKSESHRLACAEARRKKGKWVTSESTKRKQSEALKGRPHSIEHNVKVGDANVLSDRSHQNH